MLPLGGVDVNVCSGMSATETCQSPFGQLRSNSACPLCAHHGHPAEPGERSEPDIQASAPSDGDAWKRDLQSIRSLSSVNSLHQATVEARAALSRGGSKKGLCSTGSGFGTIRWCPRSMGLKRISPRSVPHALMPSTARPLSSRPVAEQRAAKLSISNSHATSRQILTGEGLMSHQQVDGCRVRVASRVNADIADRLIGSGERKGRHARVDDKTLQQIV